MTDRVIPIRGSDVRRIGELEAAVMAAVWSSPASVTVREVLDLVNNASKSRPLAYTTILSVIGKLHAKAMLERDDSGRAFRYTARLTQEEYTASLMSQTLARTSNREAALVHFVGDLSPAERDALLEHARNLKPRGVKQR